MSAPGELAVHGVLGWLQLLGGLLLFLAPGLAAADRLLGLRHRGWWFAPVFSLTLLPLGAILLDIVFQVRITTGVTVALAIGWTLAFEAPRLKRMARMRRRDWTKAAAWRPSWSFTWTGAAFLGVLALVFMAQSLPHWPGEDANPATAYLELGERGLDAMQGDDFPYPVHVDEHFHLSQQAAIERQGTIDIDNPYTGESGSTPLFSITGFRAERGFNLVMVQLHQLTGMDLATQARFVPAAQATLLAALLHATLAPSAGSRLSALLVATVPTTVRFLGPGFMVPSAFALPWIITALHITLRMQGGRRLAGLALIETGAFFMHLVPGTLTLAVAALGTMARSDPLRIRLVLLAVVFLPMIWVGPLIYQDAVNAVAREHDLPFQPGILYKAGIPVLVAAMGGTVLAFSKPDHQVHAPHRVLAILACAILVSMGLSVQADHRSDATYSRLIPTLFVCLAALAGLAIAWSAGLIGRMARQPRWVPAFSAAVALVFLAPALDFHLSSPFYRVFEEESWRDGRIFGASNATDEDVFLSDPWQAPVYNAWSGALPHTVLLPGNPPERGADWAYYLRTGGADEVWLAERGITFVIAPVEPNAPHESLGGNVYRIVPP